MKTCADCPWFKEISGLEFRSGACYAEPKAVTRNAANRACHYYLDYFERLGLTDKPKEAPHDAS